MIELNNLCRNFKFNQVLKGITYSFPDHGFYLLTGDNGCGKTTLLYILGGFDSLYTGECLLDHQELKSLSYRKKSAIRKQSIGYVFSKGNLFSFLNAEENLNFGLDQKIKNPTAAKDNQDIRTLSGGEEMILSLTNEFEKKKKVYLLDEVTSSLDSDHVKEILSLIKKSAEESLIIMATHDERVFAEGSILEISDGRIKEVNK
ncbi:MAG: ATP-binding cassette domain-containing protein [Bacilli bacterium]